MKENFRFSGKSLKNYMQTIAFLSLLSFLPDKLSGQVKVYDDFEGNRSLSYGEKNGVLDTLAKNPAPDSVNNSKTCASYVRNGTKKFDNIKMPLPGPMADVSPFATYVGVPPKLEMKIYTSAPPGTLIEILLGNRKGNNEYPAGTNSQYQAYTTVSNKWEQLEFKFSQIPQGSETATTQVDQITLLFNPNSANSDKYYFDELTGPPLATTDGKSEITQPAEEKKKVKTTKKVESAKKTSNSKKVTQK
ncbi:MAG: hypothetical protein ACXVOH_07175 [Bacteroidia bacterium]